MELTNEDLKARLKQNIADIFDQHNRYIFDIRDLSEKIIRQGDFVRTEDVTGIMEGLANEGKFVKRYAVLSPERVLLGPLYTSEDHVPEEIEGRFGRLLYRDQIDVIEVYVIAGSHNPEKDFKPE